jgi:anthranilate synthase/aminodeoxychorismate synthase-like glutamine amidotransferase
MILVIDNYDSFTYNIVQYLGELGADVQVYRNDEITVAEIEAMDPDRILVSPGPCTPNEAGISCEVIQAFGSRLPLFGVCLGHQCIGQVYGGRVVRADRLMHGKTSEILHEGEGVLQNMPLPFEATRYHSLTCRVPGIRGPVSSGIHFDPGWKADSSEFYGCLTGYAGCEMCGG